MPVNVLKHKEKLTGLKVLEKAIDLLSQDSSIDTSVLKNYHIQLTLSSLFLLVNSENVNDLLIAELKNKLPYYSMTEHKDKNSRKSCVITLKNIGLGKFYWDIFYKKEVTE